MGSYLPGGCELQVLIRNVLTDRQSPLFTQRALSFTRPAIQSSPLRGGSPATTCAREINPSAAWLCMERTGVPKRHDVGSGGFIRPGTTVEQHCQSAKSTSTSTSCKARPADPCFHPGPAASARRKAVAGNPQRFPSAQLRLEQTDKKRRRCNLRPPPERATKLSCAARNTPRAQAKPVHQPGHCQPLAPAAPAHATYLPAADVGPWRRRD